MASATEVRTLDETGKENGRWRIDCTYGASVESSTLLAALYRPIAIPVVSQAGAGNRQVSTILAGVCPRTIDLQLYTSEAIANLPSGSASAQTLPLTAFRTTPTYDKSAGVYVTLCTYESVLASNNSGLSGMFSSGDSLKRTCTVKGIKTDLL